MVSERDKRIMKLRGKVLNPPIQKMTVEEKLKNFNLANYLDFLERSKNFMLAVKGKLSPEPESAAEIFHKKALQLKFIKK